MVVVLIVITMILLKVTPLMGVRMNYNISLYEGLKEFL
nr:MAG TPA: hypothetical protein [Ackermannviridae sp.]